MKKISLLCFGVSAILFLSSCSIGRSINNITTQKENEQSPAEVKTRVYMDEVHGTLMDFDGTILTLKKDEETFFTFDVSEATLECEGGMISGDQISVIYEGKLNDNSTDTSSVRAIKVTDELHRSEELQERTGHVEVTSLTPNTITVRSKKGNTATYLATSVEQYYQNGISPGLWVYIHFKGSIEQASPDDPTVFDASHVKVISISDIDPIAVPKDFLTIDANVVPTGEAAETSASASTFRAVIQGLNMNTLSILPDGSSQMLNVNLSGIPVYLKGGAAPGSYVTVKYQGQFNGTSLDGIQITGILGDDPDALAERSISSTITGVIIGSTVNTVTVQTNDGTTITCDTQNANNLSTNDLAIGSVISITFNPADSRDSNIFHSITIKDAL
ncbi:MAG: hypothetical protein Q4B47_05885 [Eubacteriales bacterium]|nr:hypothetical protein [Eubacteriales bacterium]